MGTGSRESSAAAPAGDGCPWVLALLAWGEGGSVRGLPRASPGQWEMETVPLRPYGGPALPGSGIPGGGMRIAPRALAEPSRQRGVRETGRRDPDRPTALPSRQRGARPRGASARRPLRCHVASDDGEFA